MGATYKKRKRLRALRKTGSAIPANGGRHRFGFLADHPVFAVVGSFLYPNGRLVPSRNSTEPRP